MIRKYKYHRTLRGVSKDYYAEIRARIALARSFAFFMFLASKSGDFVGGSRLRTSSGLILQNSGNQDRQRIFSRAANTIITGNFAIATKCQSKSL